MSDEEAKQSEKKEYPTQAKGERKWNFPLPKVSLSVSCLSWALAVSVCVTVAITVGFVLYATTNRCPVSNITKPVTITTDKPDFAPNITIGISENETEHNTTVPSTFLEKSIESISFADISNQAEVNTTKGITIENNTNTGNLDQNTQGVSVAEVQRDFQNLSGPISLSIERITQGVSVAEFQRDSQNLSGPISLSIERITQGVSVAEFQRDSQNLSGPISLSIHQTVQGLAEVHSEPRSSNIQLSNVKRRRRLRRFSCPVCGKRFQRIENLESHLIIHRIEQSEKVQQQNHHNDSTIDIQQNQEL